MLASILGQSFKLRERNPHFGGQTYLVKKVPHHYYFYQNMHHIKGGCHCKNIRLEASLTQPLDSYSPRTCDCDFCRKHNASYVSDPNGSLRYHVKHPNSLGKYRQGSETADFLFCRDCGVLVGVLYQEQERLYAALNSLAVDEEAMFGAKSSVSPKTLSKEEKISRWKSVWFSDVKFSDRN